MRLFALLAVSSLVVAAAPKAGSAEAKGDALAALIKKQGREVLVDTSDGETIWSDSAVLERNKTFPKSIVALIASPSPDRKLEPGKVAGFLSSYQQHRDGYAPGAVERAGPSCFVVRGALRALVNCTYVDYLQARYPGANFFVHGALEPVLLLEQDRLHAMLMPMKP